MAITLDRFENPIILFGPVLSHHAGGGLRPPRTPTRRRPRRPLLGNDHLHLDLNLLPLDHAEVCVELDDPAVNPARNCLGDGLFLSFINHQVKPAGRCATDPPAGAVPGRLFRRIAVRGFYVLRVEPVMSNVFRVALPVRHSR